MSECAAARTMRKKRGPYVDRTGQRFGRLTVMSFSHTDDGGHSVWMCKCDCGNEKLIRGTHMTKGGTVSCGCQSLEKLLKMNTTHQKMGTPEYKSWSAMKSRCLSPSNIAYPRYGGNGITICGSWLGRNGFEQFLSDMGERPPKTSLDRIDNNSGYRPDNCRWATHKEQNRNRKSNKTVDINGESMLLVEASEKFGINPQTIAQRIDRGRNPMEKFKRNV